MVSLPTFEVLSGQGRYKMFLTPEAFFCGAASDVRSRNGKAHTVVTSAVVDGCDLKGRGSWSGRGGPGHLPLLRQAFTACPCVSGLGHVRDAVRKAESLRVYSQEQNIC